MTQQMSFEDYGAYLHSLVYIFINRTSQLLFRQREDLYQEAVCAFLHCQDGYNDEYPPRPFIRRAVFNHLNNYLKSDVRYSKIRKHVKENPMNYEDTITMDITYDQSVRCGNISRTRTSEEEDVYDQGIWELVESYERDVSPIRPQTKRYLEAYLKHGSCSKAAKALGVPRMSIHRARAKVIELLAEYV